MKCTDLQCKFEFKCVHSVTKTFLKVYVSITFGSYLATLPHSHAVSGNHSSDCIEHLNEFFCHRGSSDSRILLIWISYEWWDNQLMKFVYHLHLLDYYLLRFYWHCFNLIYIISLETYKQLFFIYSYLCKQNVEIWKWKKQTRYILRIFPKGADHWYICEIRSIM